MKNFYLHLASLLLVFTLATTIHSQAQVLRNADYQNIGRINGNGVIRDANGYALGSFERDGSLHDANGKRLGVINKYDILDANGNRLGYISTDGTVRSGDGQILGNISISDGKVTDGNHQTIGYARGIRVDWIACYYFFNFFKQ